MKTLIETLKMKKIKEEIEQRIDILNKLLVIKQDPNLEIEYTILSRKLKKIVSKIAAYELRNH